MVDEAWLLAKRAEIVSIEVCIQGMIATNKYRECIGDKPFYVEIDFQNKAAELDNIYNEIMRER